MARVLLISLLLSLVLRLSQGLICSLGEYVYMPSKGDHSICRQCEGQTFMNESVHQETQCYPCSKVTDDTKWFQFSVCTVGRDAVICPLDGFAYEVDDPTCQRIPGVCGPGGYLNSSNQCLQCPENHYMPLKSHTNHDCYKCPVPDPNGHQTNLKPCTKTQKADIGCEDGYFDMTNKSSTQPHGVQCHKCKSCSETEELKYVGRYCTQDSDTVCCPRPNMTEEIAQCVSSTSSAEPDKDQSSGSPNNTTCEESQYLSVNETCKNCSDYRGKHLPESCRPVMKKDKDDDTAVTIAVSVVVPLVIIAVIAFALLYCYLRGKLPCKPPENDSVSHPNVIYHAPPQTDMRGNDS